MRPLRVTWMMVPLAMAGGAALWWPGEADGGRSPGAAGGTSPRSHERPDPDDAGAPLSVLSGSLGTPRGESPDPVAIRLRELTRTLGLTADQRLQVGALLRRSDPGAAEASTAVAGDPGRLTRVQAEERIHALLDPVQQAEFEEILIDREQWWEEVIERLQRDLEDATRPADDFAEEPLPPPPGTPAPHRGGPLSELLNPPPS